MVSLLCHKIHILLVKFAFVYCTWDNPSFRSGGERRASLRPTREQRHLFGLYGNEEMLFVLHVDERLLFVCYKNDRFIELKKI